jgi:hypothetical protein
MQRLLLVAVAAFVLAAPALAQNQPVRVRGTIESVDGLQLTVKTRQGASMKVNLAPTYTVTAVTKGDLSDLKQGAYIGTTTVGTLPDGSLKAAEIHIFPPARRGAGEGHYAWDLAPESMMTNGDVAVVTAPASGRVLQIKYKDGEKRVTVLPDTPIVHFEPGDRDLIKPGVAVFIGTQRQPDGTMTAQAVTAGKDGVVPPL